MAKNIVLLLFAISIAVNVRAQGLKFGFVEDSDILKQMPASAEVQKILDQESVLWDQKFQDRRKVLKVYIDSINATTTALEKVREELSKPAHQEPEKAKAAEPAAADTNAAADSAGRAKGTNAGKKVEAAVEAVSVSDSLILHAKLDSLENRLSAAKTEVVAFYHKIYGSQGVLYRRNAELSQSVLEKVQRAIADTGEKLDLSVVFDSSILLYIRQDINYTNQVKEALGILPQGTR